MHSEIDFEKLVELHHASLYRFAFSLTRNEDDACDLTQQTFYIWAQKGHQLMDQTKARSWLFTTMHREFLARVRKKVRRLEVEWQEDQPEALDHAPFPFERADRRAILDALGRIDGHYQAAVALFYLEDHTHPEIARILDVPLGTVKSRISRGLAQLQGLLAGTRVVSTRKESRD